MIIPAVNVPFDHTYTGADNGVVFEKDLSDPDDPKWKYEFSIPQTETVKSVSEETEPDGYEITSAMAKTSTDPAPEVYEVTNSLKKVDLTVEKKVTGNQGSRDKYFKYTIEITGAVADTVLTLKTNNATTSFTDTSGKPNEATIYTKNMILTGTDDGSGNNSSGTNNGNTRDDDGSTTGQQIVCDSSGNATVVVYLQHGESVKLEGLTYGVKYTVTEDAEDYKPNASVSGDIKTGETRTQTGTNAGKMTEGTAIDGENKSSVTDTCLQENTTVKFTNARNAAIPTEIRLSTYTWLIWLCIPIICLILLIKKRYSEYSRR